MCSTAVLVGNDLFGKKKTRKTNENTRKTNNIFLKGNVFENLRSAFVISAQKLVFCFVHGPY